MSTAEQTAHEVDVAPFDLGDRDAPAAALCLHGLTGTPYEVRSLGVALADAGVRAVGPVLPGHDATPEILAGLRFEDWLASTRSALSSLRAAHERVFVVGLSLGGLLTLALAAEEPVDGIVVVGTPLRFRRRVRVGVSLMRHVFPYLKKREGSDIRNAAARGRHPSFPVMPMASVFELMKLQRVVEAGLHRVDAPILVAHGRHDATADPRDAQRIHRAVGSARRALLYLDDSGHVVPVDHDGPRLAEAVVKHLHHRG